jgi:hypothetical protein
MPPREARGVAPRSATHGDHPPRPHANTRTPPLFSRLTLAPPGRTQPPRSPRPVLLGDHHSGPAKGAMQPPARLAPGRSLSRSPPSTSWGWERPNRTALSAGPAPWRTPDVGALLVNFARSASARAAARLSPLPRRYLPPPGLVFVLAFEFSSLLLFVPWVLLFAFGSVLVPHLVIPDVGRAWCATAARRKDRPTSTFGAETQGTSQPPANPRARHRVPGPRPALAGGGGS